MNSFRTFALRGLTLTSLLGCSTAAWAASEPQGVLRWVGTGVQVYACKRDGGSAAWQFERPDASLADSSGQTVAQHGAGPHWASRDGSVVYGTVMTTLPAPTPGAIPWLVLRASKHEGNGQMSQVAFVLRTDTDGGVAPATGCDLAHDGAEARVPYTATYTFLVEPDQVATR